MDVCVCLFSWCKGEVHGQHLSPCVTHFFCEVGMKQEVFPPQCSTVPFAKGAPLLLSSPRSGNAALHFGCDKTQPPT